MQTQTLKVLLPSGNTVVIREQNGYDDEILSKSKDTATGSSIGKFLAGIILTHSKFPGVRLTEDHTNLMPLRDRLYLMIASRVFSLGPELKFKYEWSAPNGLVNQVDYVEDLTQYIPDLSKPQPKPGEKGYFEYAITNYPVASTEEDESFIFTTPSGNRFKFFISDGLSEKFLMTINPGDKTKNHEILARRLSWQDPNGEWIRVENFSRFSAREMAFIRDQMNIVDPNIDLVTEIRNPNNPEEVYYYPIMANQAFFFPLGI